MNFYPRFRNFRVFLVLDLLIQLKENWFTVLQWRALECSEKIVCSTDRLSLRPESHEKARERKLEQKIYFAFFLGLLSWAFPYIHDRVSESLNELCFSEQNIHLFSLYMWVFGDALHKFYESQKRLKNHLKLLYLSPWNEMIQLHDILIYKFTERSGYPSSWGNCHTAKLTNCQLTNLRSKRDLTRNQR